MTKQPTLKSQSFDGMHLWLGFNMVARAKFSQTRSAETTILLAILQAIARCIPPLYVGLHCALCAYIIL